VESPAKAKKVGEILGNEYEVLASYGHVRSLPRAAGAVIPEDNFKMLWQVMPRQEARLQELAEKARKAKAVLLATDPDREGEAISWHLHQYLKVNFLRNPFFGRLLLFPRGRRRL
jgi:DNA topoisomerase-1